MRKITLLIVLFSLSFNAQVSFTLQQELANLSYDVEFFDLENDGDLDIVFAKSGAADVIWRNDGSGNYSFFATIGAGTTTFKVLTLDFENDGDLDIVLLKAGNLNSNLYLNNGRGNFTQAPDIPTTFVQVLHSADSGDIDNDGDEDLIIAYSDQSQQGKLQILLNNGTSFTTGANTNISYPNNNFTITDIAVTDMNKDNNLDIVGVRTSNANGVILYNNISNGVAQFTTSTTINTGNVYKVKTADMNNDGETDIVVGGADTVKVLLKNNTGFTIIPLAVGTISINALELADVNNDNFLDIVFGFSTLKKIWVSNGNSTNISYSDTNADIDSSPTYAIKSGDVNGDNKIDFVFANLGSNSVKSKVWLNTSTLSNKEHIFLENKVYPNPVNKTFRLDESIEFDFIELYDVNGKMLFKKNKQQEFDISNYKTGLYILKIVGKKTSYLKLLKE